MRLRWCPKAGSADVGGRDAARGELAGEGGGVGVVGVCQWKPSPALRESMDEPSQESNTVLQRSISSGEISVCEAHGD